MTYQRTWPCVLPRSQQYTSCCQLTPSSCTQHHICTPELFHWRRFHETQRHWSMSDLRYSHPLLKYNIQIVSPGWNLAEAKTYSKIKCAGFFQISYYEINTCIQNHMLHLVLYLFYMGHQASYNIHHVIYSVTFIHRTLTLPGSMQCLWTRVIYAEVETKYRVYDGNIHLQSKIEYVNEII
jgi:hypothetical protein